MKVGLVGWGLECQSAYRYLGDQHSYVIVNEERRNDFPSGPHVEIHALSAERQPGLVGNVTDLSYLDHVKDCELIIYQPASAKNLESHFPRDICADFWAKAKTIQHIFFEECPTRQIIGVTGTKGKGTTTSLIAEMLRAMGKTVHVGGNIGVPVLDVMPLIQPEDWVVLELSSFQLYNFPYSPHIAVHLMMMPEHIEEWHKTMDDYVEAKRNLVSHQKDGDITVFLPTNPYSADNASFSGGTTIPYTKAPGAYVNDSNKIVIEDREIIDISEVALRGAHNLQNICASLTAVWQVEKNPDAVHGVIATFKGLEHRLQLAGTIDGIQYFDDSFGTTPDTAIVAMDAFVAPKIMIVGGHDKGNPMEDMCKRLVKDDIRHVVLIGSIAPKLRQLLTDYHFDESKLSYKDDGNSWTMQEIIEASRQNAQAGDVVLLSTGCASFGIFKDYKDRGNQFIETVRAISLAT